MTDNLEQIISASPLLTRTHSIRWNRLTYLLALVLSFLNVLVQVGSYGWRTQGSIVVLYGNIVIIIFCVVEVLYSECRGFWVVSDCFDI